MPIHTVAAGVRSGDVSACVCACGNSSATPAGARHARRLLGRACEALNVFIMRGINNGSQVWPFERWEHLGWN